MSATRALLAVFCLLALDLYASGQSKYALLIGIDTYQPANTTVKHPAGATTGRFAPGAPLFQQSGWSHLRCCFDARSADQQ